MDEPKWVDMPTKDGLWVTVRRTDNNLRLSMHPVSGKIDARPYKWFGPIPEPPKVGGS